MPRNNQLKFSLDSDQPLTVSQLTDMIKSALKRNLPQSLTVAGEISNLTLASSGHIYFTLKDQQAQISCAMWRSQATKIKFRLADGMAVVVQGYVDVYAPRGQYQLYAERISPFGVGELELAFRQMKEKLEREGLFDPAHKKPIPAYPLTIAVITSPIGAAVRDILRTLELRWPVGRVLIVPVQVQGDQAAPQIAQALKDVNLYAKRWEIDVILLARGGGSLEDLWAFNEEIVARAVYQSKVPVISGVGHEVDVTIADLVADVRAATPTAAAQVAAPILGEVLGDLDGAYRRLRNIIDQRLKSDQRHWRSLADRGMFRHPVVILGTFARQFDEVSQRLDGAIKQTTASKRSQIHTMELKLGRISPGVLLARNYHRLIRLQQQIKDAFFTYRIIQRGRLDRAETRLKDKSPHRRVMQGAFAVSTLAQKLESYVKNITKNRISELKHLEARVAAADYRKVLHRGFSIVRRAEDSKIVTSVEMVAENERVIMELADGKIVSRVQEKLIDGND